MVPALPDVAPCNGQDGKPCCLFTHHTRARKTGPRFALQVMGCSAHGIYFTLYPPGHVPYGRERIAPVAPDGSPCYGAEDASCFAGTWFDAALDAAAGEAWPRDFNENQPSGKPRFGTQLNRLARACLLTGVASDLPRAYRDTCVQVLAVPGQLLHDATQYIEVESGYRGRGRSVRAVLDHLAMGSSLFERLAACGAVAGLWPPLYLWQPDVGQLLPSRFQQPGTRAPPVAVGARAVPQNA